MEAVSSSAALATVWTLDDVSCDARAVSATAASASPALRRISSARPRMSPVLRVSVPFSASTRLRNAAMVWSSIIRRREANSASLL
ncbi:hypothetical protein ACFQE0_16815 [Methylobacterium komagatae]|uniref:Secreted protein n=1 Tax=Methylobacterium komagatae TaxID=374425 RepID=A0ABW2BN17_9HYPH